MSDIKDVSVSNNEDNSNSVFAFRILELRKKHGWSQPELAKKIGTSGAIIGRYERAEITPSIEVARKLADVFSVTLDYLVSDKEVPNILNNRDMIERWKALGALPQTDKERIISVVDSLIRDARAKQAYSI